MASRGRRHQFDGRKSCTRGLRGATYKAPTPWVPLKIEAEMAGQIDVVLLDVNRNLAGAWHASGREK